MLNKLLMENIGEETKQKISSVYGLPDLCESQHENIAKTGASI